jgi:hypothetical protein
MNDMTHSALPTPNGRSSVWSGIGGLAVVLIALGSALYFVKTRQVELREANSASEVAAPVMTVRPTVDVPEQALGKPVAGEKKRAANRAKRLQDAAHPREAAAPAL